MNRQRLPMEAWAIVDRRTGDLALFDHRVPVFWLRRIARSEALEHGYTTCGEDADVRVVRVKLSASPSGARG